MPLNCLVEKKRNFPTWKAAVRWGLNYLSHGWFYALNKVSGWQTIERLSQNYKHSILNLSTICQVLFVFALQGKCSRKPKCKLIEEKCLFICILIDHAINIRADVCWIARRHCGEIKSSCRQFIRQSRKGDGTFYKFAFDFASPEGDRERESKMLFMLHPDFSPLTYLAAEKITSAVL